MQERLKALRLKLNLTQSAFASRIGTTQNVVANYEIGRRNPSSSALNNICKEFNVNETWLRTGEGEMFQPKSRNDELLDYARRIAEGDPGSIQAQLLTVMTRLTDAQWEVLAQVAAQFLAEAQSQPSHEPTIDERVEAYRQELLAEEKGAEESSPSQQGRPHKILCNRPKVTV